MYLMTSFCDLRWCQWWKTPRMQLKDKYSSPDNGCHRGEESRRAMMIHWILFSSITTVTAGSANIFLFRIVDRCPENITAEFVQICSQPVQWFNTRCHEVGHMPVLLPEVKWVTAVGAAAAAAAGGESGGTDKMWAVSKDSMSQTVLWIEKGEKRRQGWRDLREVISPCIKAPV